MADMSPIPGMAGSWEGPVVLPRPTPAPAPAPAPAPPAGPGFGKRTSIPVIPAFGDGTSNVPYVSDATKALLATATSEPGAGFARLDQAYPPQSSASGVNPAPAAASQVLSQPVPTPASIAQSAVAAPVSAPAAPAHTPAQIAAWGSAPPADGSYPHPATHSAEDAIKAFAAMPFGKFKQLAALLPKPQAVDPITQAHAAMFGAAAQEHQATLQQQAAFDTAHGVSPEDHNANVMKKNAEYVQRLQEMITPNLPQYEIGRQMKQQHDLQQ